VEFCYVNSKSNRKRLVRALFNVPRTSLELLPYYSRMVATLSTCMKDVSAMLLQMLEEEFNFLINKKVWLDSGAYSFCFLITCLSSYILTSTGFWFLECFFSIITMMVKFDLFAGPNEYRN